MHIPMSVWPQIILRRCLIVVHEQLPGGDCISESLEEPRKWSSSGEATYRFSACRDKCMPCLQHTSGLSDPNDTVALYSSDSCR